MRWPGWVGPSQDLEEAGAKPQDSDLYTQAPAASDPPASDSHATTWSDFVSVQTVSASVVTAAATLALARFYRRYLRRIPNIAHIPPGIFHRRSVYGYVTSVGDGDNFRLFHTPGGRLTGWGWLPGRKPQDLKGRALQDRTLHVRIAGIDAPEMAHFGHPAQPFSQDALDWLRGDILRRYVRVWPYRRDQYGRVVCTVYRRAWLFGKTDVGLSMLRRGWATVYEAKFGSEFGNKENQYRAAEERAKARKLGMWQEPGMVGRLLLGKKKTALESPRQYKTRISKEEATK